MDDSTVFRKVTLLQFRESPSVWQEAFLDSKAFMCYFFHIFIQLPFSSCFDFYPCLTFVFVSVFDNSHHSSFHSVFLPSPWRVAGCVSVSLSIAQRSLALPALKKNTESLYYYDTYRRTAY